MFNEALYHRINQAMCHQAYQTQGDITIRICHNQLMFIVTLLEKTTTGAVKNVKAQDLEFTCRQDKIYQALET
jgi:hypothetical protein